MDRIAIERAELYMCIPHEVPQVPILVTPAAVEDGIPQEAEEEQTVRVLKRGRDGGPSSMQAEVLRGWLREASRETNPVKHRWRLLVRLIHKTFKDKVVPEEVEWATMVSYQKGGGGGVSGDRVFSR